LNSTIVIGRSGSGAAGATWAHAIAAPSSCWTAPSWTTRPAKTWQEREFCALLAYGLMSSLEKDRQILEQLLMVKGGKPKKGNIG
jgi:hypothetical protein